MSRPLTAQRLSPRALPAANPHTCGFPASLLIAALVVTVAVGSLVAPARPAGADIPAPHASDTGWMPDLGAAIESVTEQLRLDVLAWLDATSAAQERRLEREAFWDEMAHCETGGDWQDPGQWAGGLGIYLGTWRTVGGEDFAARPDLASKSAQIEVAERIVDEFGIHAWGCAAALGL